VNRITLNGTGAGAESGADSTLDRPIETDAPTPLAQGLPFRRDRAHTAQAPVQASGTTRGIGRIASAL